MQVKGKRVLKNGALAGYVRQSDGSWKWRIISGPKRGGSPSPKKNSPKKNTPKKNRTPKPWLMTNNELNKARKNRAVHEKVFLEKLHEEGGDLQKMFTKGTIVATPKITDKSILLTINGSDVDKLLDKHSIERENTNKREYYNVFLADKPEGLEVSDSPIKVKFGDIYCVKHKEGAPSAYKFCAVDLEVDDEKLASVARVVLTTKIRIFNTKLPYGKNNRHNIPNKNVKSILEEMAKRNNKKKKKTPSPNKKKTPSPKKNKTPSPKKNKTPSPNKKKTPSPKKKKTPSPKKKKTPTPA